VNKRFMLGAYWGPRKESIDQCAARMVSFFDALAHSDPALATWYERGKSRQAAIASVANVHDQSYVLGLLERGRNRKDIGRSVIEDLGFHVGLWNGGISGRDAGLSITCGLCWTGSGNAGLLNSVVLDLPQDLGELGQSEKMSSLLSSVADVWNPEWAGIMSKDAMRSRNFNARVPFVDWMLFTPRELPLSNPPFSVARTGSGGYLVVVQAEPPSDTDPQARARIALVEKAVAR